MPPTERTDGGGDETRRAGTGVALLLAAAVLWSLNGLFIKHLNAAGIDGWSIAGYRSLFACLVILPFAWRRRRPICNPGWLLATVLTFTGMCATFVIATTLTTAANAIILQYTAPAWVFVVAPFITGERATREQHRGLTLSLLGVLLIFGFQWTPGQPGLVIGLASGLVFGVQSVLFRKVREIDPLALVCMVCGGSAILLLGVALAAGSPRPAGSVLGLLVLMGIVQFGLPYVLYSAALTRVSAQQAILIILVEAVLNPTWVWLVQGEVPHASTFAGGLCILGSIVYLTVLQLVHRRRYEVAQ